EFSGRTVASSRCSPTGPKQWSTLSATAAVATPPPASASVTQSPTQADRNAPRTMLPTVSSPANSPSTSTANGTACPRRAIQRRPLGRPRRHRVALLPAADRRRLPALQVSPIPQPSAAPRPTVPQPGWPQLDPAAGGDQRAEPRRPPRVAADGEVLELRGAHRRITIAATGI